VVDLGFCVFVGISLNRKNRSVLMNRTGKPENRNQFKIQPIGF